VASSCGCGLGLAAELFACRALAIGPTGAEGKVTGLVFSALAIATFARCAVAVDGQKVPELAAAFCMGTAIACLGVAARGGWSSSPPLHAFQFRPRLELHPEWRWRQKSVVALRRPRDLRITAASLATSYAYIADVTLPTCGRVALRHDRCGLRRRFRRWARAPRPCRRGLSRFAFWIGRS